MKCTACDGKGFTERNLGLLMIQCEECGGSGEVEEQGIILTPGSLLKEVTNDSDNGTERDNQDTGSANTSKPRKSTKPKTSKKTRARAK